MLSNDVIFVIVYMDAPNQAGLRAAVHDLAVQIKRRAAIAHENSRSDEGIEGFAGLAVYPRIVWVDISREIDVGSSNVQEAVGITEAQLCSLIPADDIVRHSSDLGSQLGLGPKRIEGMESH
jgi:hypothetical protein